MSTISIARKTRNAVLRSKKRVWTIADFRTDKARAALRELNRLADEGLLVRASKGIYVRPTHTALGPSTLSKEEVATAKARKKGANVVTTGYTGFNRLGITTQVSGIAELAVDRPIRISGPEKSRVRFLVRDRRMLANPTECIALEALRRVNHISDTTPAEVIRAVKENIKSAKISFDNLARLSLRSEPPRVRALVGAIGEDLKVAPDMVRHLYQSLNPTTVFHIATENSLRSANKWRIQR